MGKIMLLLDIKEEFDPMLSSFLFTPKPTPPLATVVAFLSSTEFCLIRAKFLKNPCLLRNILNRMANIE